MSFFFRNKTNNVKDYLQKTNVFFPDLPALFLHFTFFQQPEGFITGHYISLIFGGRYYLGPKGSYLGKLSVQKS